MSRLEKISNHIRSEAAKMNGLLRAKGFGFVGSVDDLTNDGWVGYYTYLDEIETKTGEKSLSFVFSFVEKFMKLQMNKYAGVDISHYKFWKMMSSEHDDEVSVLYIEDLDYSIDDDTE